jgi:hypothetical protein
MDCDERLVPRWGEGESDFVPCRCNDETRLMKSCLFGEDGEGGLIERTKRSFALYTVSYLLHPNLSAWAL